MYIYTYACYEQSEFSYVSINVADLLLHLKDRIMNNYTTSLKNLKICTAFCLFKKYFICARCLSIILPFKAIMMLKQKSLLNQFL